MLIYESSICYNFLNVFITTSKISSFVTMEGTLMSNKYDALLSHLQEEKNPTQCTLLKLYMLIRKKSSASFSFANRKTVRKFPIKIKVICCYTKLVHLTKFTSGIVVKVMRKKITVYASFLFA